MLARIRKGWKESGEAAKWVQEAKSQYRYESDEDWGVTFVLTAIPAAGWALVKIANGVAMKINQYPAVMAIQAVKIAAYQEVK